MELVINIPEEIYNIVQNKLDFNGDLDKQSVKTLMLAIDNGILLQKGHGRLIDADKAEREENSKMVDFETTNARDRSYCRYARLILNDAPTIIKADKR